MEGVIVIGIAGGTGSGKTSVASLILEDLKKFGTKISLLEQDSYYKDHGDKSFEERSKLNYDHPNAIDFELLEKHIKMLKNGQDIEKPIYDFTTHRRTDKTELVSRASIIIVEGILIFTIASMRELFDMKVFVDTDDDIRLLRRIERDMNERGRSFENIRNQYIETVKPMHLEFVEPTKRYADIIIPRGKSNKVGIKMITSRLKYLLKK